MNKQSKPVATSMKKLTLEDLDQVVGGAVTSGIKIEVESVPNLQHDLVARKASGEG